MEKELILVNRKVTVENRQKQRACRKRKMEKSVKSPSPKKRVKKAVVSSSSSESSEERNSECKKPKKKSKKRIGKDRKTRKATWSDKKKKNRDKKRISKSRKNVS